MPRFRIVVNTSFCGCEHHDEVEYSQEVWGVMTEEEREKARDRCCQETINNFIDAYWEEITENE